jgi:transcriptional regulator with PAS, ATPase and Fis domain
MPSLRDRLDDIVPMAELFIKKYSRKYAKRVDGLDSMGAKTLTEYRWPGNIRELDHTIEKSVILCQDSIISSKDLLISPVKRGAISKGDVMPLDILEREMIYKALHKFGGNMSHVADKLGITRQTLYNKIKKYGI